MDAKITGFCVFGLLFINTVSAFDGSLLKHLPQPKPGGLLDVLKKPKIPGINIHLSKGGGGFGAGASIGSFGIGIGFGGPYVPPGTEANKPPKEPHVTDVDYHFPDLKPGQPVVNPPLPYPKPHPSGMIPEKEKDDKGWPNWEEYEDDPNSGGSEEEDKHPKVDSHEVEYTKPDSYDGNEENTRPAWEDIGEIDDSNSKSEKFMNEDLVNGGLIQPRLNKKRNRRFIESHVYHVPILFRSNAKPFQVKVQSNPNSLLKEVL